eukprot:m.362192 g.362192  ORF g.362192 m.362192 type:complete len:1364 (-) comp20200_c0_seq1:375-4466(-)
MTDSVDTLDLPDVDYCEDKSEAQPKPTAESSRPRSVRERLVRRLTSSASTSSETGESGGERPLSTYQPSARPSTNTSAAQRPPSDLADEAPPTKRPSIHERLGQRVDQSGASVRPNVFARLNRKPSASTDSHELRSQSDGRQTDADMHDKQTAPKKGRSVQAIHHEVAANVATTSDHEEEKPYVAETFQQDEGDREVDSSDKAASQPRLPASLLPQHFYIIYSPTRKRVDAAHKFNTWEISDAHLEQLRDEMQVARIVLFFACPDRAAIIGFAQAVSFREPRYPGGKHRLGIKWLNRKTLPVVDLNSVAPTLFSRDTMRSVVPKLGKWILLETTLARTIERCLVTTPSLKRAKKGPPVRGPSATPEVGDRDQHGFQDVDAAFHRRDRKGPPRREYEMPRQARYQDPNWEQDFFHRDEFEHRHQTRGDRLSHQDDRSLVHSRPRHPDFGSGRMPSALRDSSDQAQWYDEHSAFRDERQGILFDHAPPSYSRARGGVVRDFDGYDGWDDPREPPLDYKHSRPSRDAHPTERSRFGSHRQRSPSPVRRRDMAEPAPFRRSPPSVRRPPQDRRVHGQRRFERPTLEARSLDTRPSRFREAQKHGSRLPQRQRSYDRYEQDRQQQSPTNPQDLPSMWSSNGMEYKLQPEKDPQQEQNATPPRHGTQSEDWETDQAEVAVADEEMHPSEAEITMSNAEQEMEQVGEAERGAFGQDVEQDIAKPMQTGQKPSTAENVTDGNVLQYEEAQQGAVGMDIPDKHETSSSPSQGHVDDVVDVLHHVQVDSAEAQIEASVVHKHPTQDEQEEGMQDRSATLGDTSLSGDQDPKSPNPTNGEELYGTECDARMPEDEHASETKTADDGSEQDRYAVQTEDATRAVRNAAHKDRRIVQHEAPRDHRDYGRRRRSDRDEQPYRRDQRNRQSKNHPRGSSDDDTSTYRMRTQRATPPRTQRSPPPGRYPRPRDERSVRPGRDMPRDFARQQPHDRRHREEWEFGARGAVERGGYSEEAQHQRPRQRFSRDFEPFDRMYEPRDSIMYRPQYDERDVVEPQRLVHRPQEHMRYREERDFEFDDRDPYTARYSEEQPRRQLHRDAPSRRASDPIRSQPRHLGRDVSLDWESQRYPRHYAAEDVRSYDDARAPYYASRSQPSNMYDQSPEWTRGPSARERRRQSPPLQDRHPHRQDPRSARSPSVESSHSYDQRSRRGSMERRSMERRSSQPGYQRSDPHDELPKTQQRQRSVRKMQEPSRSRQNAQSDRRPVSWQEFPEELPDSRADPRTGYSSTASDVPRGKSPPARTTARRQTPPRESRTQTEYPSIPQASSLPPGQLQRQPVRSAPQSMVAPAISFQVPQQFMIPTARFGSQPNIAEQQ